jgi:hypothetical protein
VFTLPLAPNRHGKGLVDFRKSVASAYFGPTIGSTTPLLNGRIKPWSMKCWDQNGRVDLSHLPQSDQNWVYQTRFYSLKSCMIASHFIESDPFYKANMFLLNIGDLGTSIKKLMVLIFSAQKVYRPPPVGGGRYEKKFVQDCRVHGQWKCCNT